MSALSRKERNSLRSQFPRRALSFLGEEFEDFVQRLGSWEGQFHSQFMAPSLDIAETESSVDVSMDVPGMKAEDIDIQVVGKLLTIAGERHEENEEKDGTAFHRIERHMGQFSRSVQLPCEIDESKVEAAYQNGVLKIKLPKNDEAKKHKIKVTA